jgi:5-oxoprolinase (ATP-hydrolysing)
MRHIRASAERKTRLALGALPPGRRQFADALDDGTPVVVTVTIPDAGDGGPAAIVDFSGTGPVSAGNLNANAAIVKAATLYTLRCLIAEELPLNEGVLAAVRLVVPTPSLLSPPAGDDPTRLAAVVGGNVETSQRLVDVLLAAFGLAAASQGTMNNFLFGRPPAEDRPGFGYYETICGGAGAGPGFRGADAVHTHMTNTRITDPEVLERRYPVILRSFAIRRGSGGTGQQLGGNGVVREVELREPLHVSLLTTRRVLAPFGLEGGLPGKTGRNVYVKKDGSEILLAGMAQLEADAGERLRIETPGGGGYGVALRRLQIEVPHGLEEGNSTTEDGQGRKDEHRPAL